MTEKKDNKKNKTNRNLSKGSYFILWGFVFFILAGIGFYHGRLQKKQWIDQEAVIYFYTDNDFISEDLFLNFEINNGLKVVLKKYSNFEDLNLEIITYHQDAVMLISEKWMRELVKQNLLSVPLAKWQDSLHTIFKAEKSKDYIPYIWTIKNSNREDTTSDKSIFVWGLGTPSNSDRTDNTNNLIETILEKKFILSLLSKHPELASTLNLIEKDPVLPLDQKPSAVLKYNLFTGE